jgi:histidinol-phosphate/aromatic aminotransferase/cobyric acid decarboxylase-like protein
MAKFAIPPPSFIDTGLEACANDSSVIDFYSPTNRLTLPLLLPHFHNRPGLALTDLLYSSTRNDRPFLESVSNFFRKYLGISTVQFLTGGDPSFFYEQVSLAFCEPGEVLLLPHYFPREYLPFFAHATVQFIDPASLSETPPEKARLLFLTNPAVPFDDRNSELIEWALQAPDLQVVVDESLGASERGPPAFRSLVSRARVHGLFSFAPLFGLSGLHISVLYSENSEFIDIVRETFGAWRNDSYCEWVCREILSDEPLVEKVLSAFKEGVVDSERFIAAECAAAGIVATVFPTGVYVRLDCGSAVDDQVFQRLLEREKVFVCPAAIAFGEAQTGRCYINAALQREELARGLASLIAVVRAAVAE